MFSTSELRSLILNSYYYIMFRMAIRIQTSLTSAVYKKTLLLSSSARRNRTIGEIINLMAIDVERFQMITPQTQQFWSCPYQITLALVYLFFTLGYSAVPGVVIMIIFVPRVKYGDLSAYTATRRLRTGKRTVLPSRAGTGGQNFTQMESLILLRPNFCAVEFNFKKLRQLSNYREHCHNQYSNFVRRFSRRIMVSCLFSFSFFKGEYANPKSTNIFT
ncbi:unnamed protein product [Caenorhabditis brenneri]